MVVTDGRRPGYSVGMTNFELAQTLVRLGAVTGSALDGGGSSSLAFDGKLLSRPSDRGGERAVSTSLQLAYYGVYAPSPDAVISPNGDGVAEKQRALSYKVVRPSKVTATLVAPDGVRRLHGDGRPRSPAPTRSRSRRLRHRPRLRSRPCRPPRRPRPSPRHRPPSPAPRRKGAGGSTSARPTTSAAPRRRQQRFTVNNTLGFARISRRSLVVRLKPKTRQTVNAGVTLTRPVTADRDRRDRVRRPRRHDRRAPAAGRPLRRTLERDAARRQVPGLQRALCDPLPRHERARRRRARLADLPGDPGKDAREEEAAAPGNVPAVPVASILSEITDLLTTVVGDYGFYAVFLLMLVDAVFPAASEPVMVYGGAVAAGAFAGQDVQLFGWRLDPGFEAYLGDRARRHDRLHARLDRRLVDRPARRPAVPRAPRPLAAPERGEARPGGALVRALGGLGRLPRPHHAGRSLVRLDPGRRLRGAVPALHRPDADRLARSGASRSPASGWALGSRWEDFHHAFRYVDYAIARVDRRRRRLSGLEAAAAPRQAAAEPR